MKKSILGLLLLTILTSTACIEFYPDEGIDNNEEAEKQPEHPEHYDFDWAKLKSSTLKYNFCLNTIESKNDQRNEVDAFYKMHTDMRQITSKRFVDSIDLDKVLDSFDVSVDQKKFSTCLKELEEVENCEGTLSDDSACYTMITPLLDENASCTFSASCEGFCDMPVGECKGQCVNYKKKGEECDATFPCEEELECGYNDTCEEIYIPKVGDTCTLNPGVSDSCNSSGGALLYCGPENNCVAKEIKKLGEECDPQSVSINVCENFLSTTMCIPNGSLTSGICIKRKGLNEEASLLDLCDATISRGREDGVCQPLLKKGDSCRGEDLAIDGCNFNEGLTCGYNHECVEIGSELCMD